MSQEIENNFEERKKDWDLTGLLDDVIRRYIYQLTNDELNEINLEKASGMPDEEIKNGIKLPLATSLVDDIMDDKTFISRIPGSKLHIKLPLFSIADDGKTLVSAIDPQKEYEIFKNDSPTSNPLLNMKGAQILPYYDPVRRKNITKQFGQNQNKILKFSQNPASKHKPKSSPIRKKDLKL